MRIRCRAEDEIKIDEMKKRKDKNQKHTKHEILANKNKMNENYIIILVIL